jgi:hypothetical protein
MSRLLAEKELAVLIRMATRDNPLEINWLTQGATICENCLWAIQALEQMREHIQY